MPKLYRLKVESDYEVHAEVMAVTDDPIEMSNWLNKRGFRYLYKAARDARRGDFWTNAKLEDGFFYVKSTPGVWIRNRGDDTYAPTGTYLVRTLEPGSPVMAVSEEKFRLQYEELES